MTKDIDPVLREWMKGGKSLGDLVILIREDERRQAGDRVTEAAWLEGGRTVNRAAAIMAARCDTGWKTPASRIRR